MDRSEKYPNTPTFRFHNQNPKNKFVSDCVVRALSTALGRDWDTVLTELTEIAIKTKAMPNEKATYKEYLKAQGYTMQKQPKKENGKKYTSKEFCEQLQDDPWPFTGKEGHAHTPIIAHIGVHHIVAIVEGQVWDTWNCTGKCVGNYFTKD